MAINKVPYPTSTPAAVTDYQRQNALIAALVGAIEGTQKIIGSNVAKGAVFNVGGSLYLADADTAISGVASEYVKLTPSGDTLTLAASYVASLSGVAWNSTYNGYYDGSGNLYEFDELKALAAGAIATPYKFAIGIGKLGAPWITKLAGHPAIPLYTFYNSASPASALDAILLALFGDLPIGTRFGLSGGITVGSIIIDSLAFVIKNSAVNVSLFGTRSGDPSGAWVILNSVDHKDDAVEGCFSVIG